MWPWDPYVADLPQCWCYSRRIHHPKCRRTPKHPNYVGLQVQSTLSCAKRLQPNARRLKHIISDSRDCYCSHHFHFAGADSYIGSDDDTTSRSSWTTSLLAGNTWRPNALYLHHDRCKWRHGGPAGRIHSHGTTNRTSRGDDHRHHSRLFPVVINDRNIHSAGQRCPQVGANGNWMVLFRSNCLCWPRRRRMADHLVNR